MFFVYISAPYWPINAKFGVERKNRMQISVTWPTGQFSKIQDCAILKIALFPQLSAKLWNLEQIWWTDADFHSQRGYLAKSRNFANSTWRTDAILKIVFLAISRRHFSRCDKWTNATYRDYKTSLTATCLLDLDTPTLRVCVCVCVCVWHMTRWLHGRSDQIVVNDRSLANECPTFFCTRYSYTAAVKSHS